MIATLFQNGPSEAVQLGGVIALAFGLIEAIKMLIAKMGSSARTGFYAADREKLSDIHRDRSRLKDLHVWHSPEGGRQEWKNPEIRDVLAEISDTLKDIKAQGEQHD